ncbi:DedA family protein [Thermospira aquatica]|uniref:DedA family protein n=1 Tax=Thermospira aquatica TaxID=2828656 RepID=A0AAX3BG59_9SPIR|nr:DedA family protein [Thermospira aquatica]URA11155.1 DedA family protein [Thermospira aquatica]
MPWVTGILTWYMNHINYGSVFLLMLIESSFIPFPSEVVVPPAAYLVAQGKLNGMAVMAVSTLGALGGALINYILAVIIGRPVLYALADTRWLHFLLITRENVEKAEKFFVKYGNLSTFIGRFVPAIRQLISVPAGLSRMPLLPFLFYTTLGAGLWNLILFILGYWFYQQKAFFERYYHLITYAIVILVGLFVVWMVYNGLKPTKKQGEKP